MKFALITCEKKTSLLPFFVSSTVCGLCIITAASVYWDLSQPQLPPLVAEPLVMDLGENRLPRVPCAEYRTRLLEKVAYPAGSS